MPKQVIVLRTRFEVPDDKGGVKLVTPRKGKLVAQGAHASMKAVLDLARQEGGTLIIPLDDPDLKAWLVGNFKKIAVSVETEQELLDVYRRAQEAGLICSLIQDSGLTEFGGVPTYTAVAVGPASDEAVNAITGELKLL